MPSLYRFARPSFALRVAAIAAACWALPAIAEEPFVLTALDGTVKAAPVDPDDARKESLCEGESRTPEGAADQALVGAGWLPFFAPQVLGETRVITAASHLDGQCRPRGLAGFVFVGDRAVAQIAPFDPKVGPAFEVSATNTVKVTATAFGPNDPGCCPSIKHERTVRLVDGKAQFEPAK